MTSEFNEIDLNTARTEAEWLARLEEIGDEVGMFIPLGAHHAAFFADGDDTLLVSFEAVADIRANHEDQRPRALRIAQRHGWSCLVIVARAERFFRDEEVLDFFDAQIDASFFESFRRVLFFGAGSCGYAACAFSLAAPGATVLAIAPISTLDPEIAPWDRRFMGQRRLDFRTRFGFAPAMMEGLRKAFVVYDPTQAVDAMHATMFRMPHVTILRSPALGPDTAAGLDRLGVYDRLVEVTLRGRLTPLRFAGMMRKRRNDPTYMHALVQRLSQSDHPALTVVAARHALGLKASPSVGKTPEGADDSAQDDLS